MPVGCCSLPAWVHVQLPKQTGIGSAQAGAVAACVPAVL